MSDWHRTDYEVRSKFLPNGNLRVFVDDYKKSCVSECCAIDTNNECPTIITAHVPNIIENQEKHDMAKIYRIRKLTSREAFRLMGVSDADIDKIQAAGISESQQYKLAGNSIVVDTLLHGIYIPLFAKQDGRDDTLF